MQVLFQFDMALLTFVCFATLWISRNSIISKHFFRQNAACNVIIISQRILEFKIPTFKRLRFINPRIKGGLVNCSLNRYMMKLCRSGNICIYQNINAYGIFSHNSYLSQNYMKWLICSSIEIKMNPIAGWFERNIPPEPGIVKKVISRKYQKIYFFGQKFQLSKW